MLHSRIFTYATTDGIIKAGVRAEPGANHNLIDQTIKCLLGDLANLRESKHDLNSVTIDARGSWRHMSHTGLLTLIFMVKLSSSGSPNHCVSLQIMFK